MFPHPPRAFTHRRLCGDQDILKIVRLISHGGRSREAELSSFRFPAACPRDMPAAVSNSFTVPALPYLTYLL